jgi:hypothetical protein
MTLRMAINDTRNIHLHIEYPFSQQCHHSLDEISKIVWLELIEPILSCGLSDLEA